MKKHINIYLYIIGVFSIGLSTVQGQDIIHLRDGDSVVCHITEITDFILYAEVYNDPYPATFFADDVSHLKIDPKNSIIIRQLKKGVKDAMEYSNPLEDNSLFGFYFGMPYDSIANNKGTKDLYRTDSLGNPILVPYDPLDTNFAERLKSLGRSIGGNSLAWIIGL